MSLFHDGASDFSRCSSSGNEVDVMVGVNLRRLRYSRGLSVIRLAALIGVSSNDIDLFETGAARPKPKVLNDLANALDEPISSFFAASKPREKPLGSVC